MRPMKNHYNIMRYLIQDLSHELDGIQHTHDLRFESRTGLAASIDY
jgi:hypothetical protein